MIAWVAIVGGPVTPQAEAAARAAGGQPRPGSAREGGVGATLRFEGVVRRMEGGRELLALDYQTYDPMAQRELETLARIVGERYGLISIIALHSRGMVGVGEVSFLLEVSASHRKEAIGAVMEFIDRLKQDVPIWKRPVWPR